MTVKAANVLYVTTDGSQLGREGDTVIVRVAGEKRVQVPFVHLEAVVILAGVSVSPELLGGLVEAGVHVAYFSSGGRFFARVDGLPGGNVLLRKAQVRASDDARATLALAKAFVIGKIASQRRQLRRANREDGGNGTHPVAVAADRLQVLGRQAMQSEELDSLRGLEGAGAREYFGVFNALIRTDVTEFMFAGRRRRPPGDPVNAMLSFGYALLMRDCAGALAGVGLDPAIGFLHEDRPGRLGLALDLMEELRVPVVDRLVLALINRNQLSPTDFSKRADGGWEFIDQGRRVFIAAYQKAKQASLRHHFLEQDATWGMVPHLQARLLARALRGDLEVYPPFEVK